MEKEGYNRKAQFGVRLFALQFQEEKRSPQEVQLFLELYLPGVVCKRFCTCYVALQRDLFPLFFPFREWETVVMGG